MVDNARHGSPVSTNSFRWQVFKVTASKALRVTAAAAVALLALTALHGCGYVMPKAATHSVAVSPNAAVTAPTGPIGTGPSPVSGLTLIIAAGGAVTAAFGLTATECVAAFGMT